MLDVPADWVRSLDLGSFTGDTWAVEATIAAPSDDVPRFVSDGSTVRWTVMGMTGGDPGATQEADTTTQFATRVVKLHRTKRGNTIVRLMDATGPGTNVNRDFEEPEVAAGDVFVIAVTTVTAGAAAFLWAYPTAGARLVDSDRVP